MILKQTYLLVFFILLGFGVRTQTSERLDNATMVAFTNTFINADKERVLGNYQEAFKLYSKCLEIDSKNDAVYYSIGRLFLTQNKLSQAALNFEYASKLDPTNKYYLIELIEVLMNQEAFKDANKAFKKLRDLEPENPEYIYNHASMLLYARKPKKAFSTFEEFEAIAGPSPEIASLKFKYLIGVEKMGEAEEVLLDAIRNFPSETKFHGFLADLYKAQGQTKKAIVIYQDAMALDPGNPYIQLSLAQYYEQISAADSSQAYLMKAFQNKGLDIDSKVGVLLSKYSEAELHNSVRENMLSLCDALVKTHPAEAKSHSVYGDFLYLDGQLEKARRSYYNTLDLDQSRFAIWNQILLIDSELSDAQSMLKDSEKALELFPTQPSIYLFNGIANNQLNNHKAAAKSLKTGSNMVVGNFFLSAQILASLGDAYHELELHKSSDSAYTASLRYDSTNQYVLNNYAYFLSLRGENLMEAKRMSEKTIQKSPSNASYLDTYGWILYQLEDYGAAEKHLAQALKNGGDSSHEVLEHYGDVLFKLGNLDGAKEYWKKAIDAGGDLKSIQQKIESGILE